MNKISASVLSQIITAVQAKSELSTFSEAYIERYAQHLVAKNRKLRLFLESSTGSLEKNKQFIALVKQIREKARRIYGLYMLREYAKRTEVLKKYDGSEKATKELLALHLSTKERLNEYSELYAKIIKITGVPESVLDLACGLNPAAAWYLHASGSSKLTYVASDISEKNVEFLQSLLSAMAVQKVIHKGVALRLDLSEEESVGKVSHFKTDWCLLFKALDPIEESSENITYKLISAIVSRWVIVSFPTKNIATRNMRNPRRMWFEKVLNRLSKQYSIVEHNDELFYVVNNETKVNS